MNRAIFFFLSVNKKIQYLTNPTGVSMKFTSHFYVLIACSFLAACGTVMKAEQTTFLSSYAGLITGADEGQAILRAHSGIDPARIQLGEVIMQPGAGVALSSEERNQLTALLRQQLQQRVQEMPKNPTGQAAVLRAAITRVETVSPGLNTVGTLLSTGWSWVKNHKREVAGGALITTAVVGSTLKIAAFSCDISIKLRSSPQ